MLDPVVRERASAAIGVKLMVLQDQFPRQLHQIDATCAAAGAFRSSRRVLEIHAAFQTQLRARATVIWQSYVRAHSARGAPLSDTLRGDLKAAFREDFAMSFADLSGQFTERLAAMTAGMQSMNLSLDDVRDLVLQEHETEIDFYVDALETNAKERSGDSKTATYNFYGNVGAVQTGPQAVANVAQGLTNEERNQLTEALRLVAQAIEASNLVDTKKRELIEIASEATAQVTSESPNTSKLLMTFNLLAGTVQGLGSATGAYEALRTAALALGMTL